MFMVQVLSFAEDPYASFASNEDNFTSGASPVGMKIVGSADKVSYKAASKANLSIPSDNYNMTEDGVVTTYLIEDLDTFMKVC